MCLEATKNLGLCFVCVFFKLMVVIEPLNIKYSIKLCISVEYIFIQLNVLECTFGVHLYKDSMGNCSKD